MAWVVNLEAQDLIGARARAAALLKIDREGLQALALHCAVQLAFDQGGDQVRSARRSDTARTSCAPVSRHPIARSRTPTRGRSHCLTAGSDMLLQPGEICRANPQACSGPAFLCCLHVAGVNLERTRVDKECCCTTAR